MKATRNQHYVWAHYLRKWSTDKQNVWYTTDKGNVALGSTKGISKEDYFYKVERLTQDHVEVIRSWSSLSPAKLVEHHNKYLSDFIILQNTENLIRSMGPVPKEVEEAIHAVRSNSIESYHSIHENEVRDILDALSEGDGSMLSDSRHMLSFTSFMGHQMTRAKSFRDLMSASLLSGGVTDKNILRISNITEESWWFLGYMFGMNIGRSIYLSRHDDTHNILINKTDIPFISSDNPIINIHKNRGRDPGSPPADEECDFFYPISPSVAYMVSKSGRYPSGRIDISSEEANSFNVEIVQHAAIHIVGRERSDVDRYKEHVGAWKALVNEYLGNK